MSDLACPDVIREPETDTDRPQLQRPPMFRVIMLNDDYTPMDFVVEILRRHFQKSLEEATRIMLQIHHLGSAVCGTYPYDVAESKVAVVENTSRMEGHPLRCVMEEADTD